MVRLRVTEIEWNAYFNFNFNSKMVRLREKQKFGHEKSSKFQFQNGTIKRPKIQK